jgi:uncharacterized protein (DUF885 family)
MRQAALLLFLLVLASCAPRTPPSQFTKVSEEAVYKLLSFSPVHASGQGLHQWNGQDFDSELDDLSFRGVQKERDYLVDLHKRLEAFDQNALTPEDRADRDIISYEIGRSLFDLDVARSWQRSPQTYVELIGGALFNPFVLEYAPKQDRYRHIIARLEKIPNFLDVARRQLSGVPPIWANVAKEENDGNIALVGKTLRDGAPPDLKAAYETAAGPALDALRGFNRFIEVELPRRASRRGGGPDNPPPGRGNTPDWRLGADEYATKFKLVLATTRTPDQVLSDAATRLKEVRARMLEIALPLHGGWYPGHGAHNELKGSERDNKITREVLDRIAQDHSTVAGYMDDARKDLNEARGFVQARNLLTLPNGGNLQVIPTPEFERGIYAVGGFNPAPALEPRLGAFFWLTPIPADWPKDRIDSKLREYNAWSLRILVIHEAMPGHYVQAEFANNMQPKARRLLRAIFGNGPYVEGWAQYITGVMLDEGFLDHSPELRLSLLKQELRVDANAILDIRLQTNRMTDEEAMDLMENSTFQEHEEAVAKLQRAKLSSTQLPTYFVGWRDWLRVRELAKQSSGSSFNSHDFHDRALQEGAVPLPVLARLLTGKTL